MKQTETPGKLKYRQGVFSESAEYQSLTVLEVKEKDRKYVEKVLASLNTGEQAEAFVRSLSNHNRGAQLYQMVKVAMGAWSYSTADMYGRIGILKYKGIEVGLFFKRQLNPHRVSPDSPISELRLQNTDDAWIRPNLFGLSARQASIRKNEEAEQLRKLLDDAEQKLLASRKLTAKLERRLDASSKSSEKARKTKSRAGDNKDRKKRRR